MEEIILYLCIRYSFNWLKVVKAMQNNIEVSPQDFKNTSEIIMVKYLTILNDDVYPTYLQSTLNPPLALFYLGNLELFDKQRIIILGHINKQNSKYLKVIANLGYVLCFCYDILNKQDMELLIELNLPVILYTKTLQNTTVHNPLYDYIKATKNLVISEAIGNDYLFCSWQFLRLFFDHTDKILIIDELIEIEENVLDWINEHCGFSYIVASSENNILFHKLINSKRVTSTNMLRDSFI